MTTTIDAPYPLCECMHPWGDHQQPVDLAGDCDLCDCQTYTPREPTETEAN